MPILESIPEYFKPYVKRVQSENANTALEEQLNEMAAIYQTMSPEKADSRYAEGKWSPKQIVQHIIDTERILSQRALRFSRRDMTQLPGFDHELYVESANVNHRIIENLWDEFMAVRVSTKLLYLSFGEKELSREGFANGMVLSVENLAYIMAGHALHHTEIIKERYL